MSAIFQFKQFALKQDQCAMKVGTDGVLLGVWTKIPNRNVLDIGSGTGLIGLMIAQRNPNCLIDSIEIDENAFLQTSENIENCKWKNRMKAFHTSLQDFTPDKKYQLIVSNPPFFVNATKAENLSKNTARHTDELSYSDLLQNVSKLLASDGVFSLILPVFSEIEFCNLAKTNQLFLNRICYVKPNQEKNSKRILMEFSFTSKPSIIEKLTIETDERHHYTEDYRNLTKEFYLNF